jgi:hypothetical protein
MYGVSISGPLKEVPRSDILATPDEREGLRALRKISASRTDKTKQVFFQAKEGLKL